MPKADVTEYANKPPTDHHKWFATWIVREVGYDPNEAPSLKAAFLAGVSIATASRPAFMASEFLEEMRAKHGVNKRGPKPAEETEEEAPAPRRAPTKKVAPAKKATPAARKRAPEPEPEEEEWEDDSAEETDDFDTESDDDFADEEEEDTDFDDDDFAEEAPAPAKRTPAKKTAPAKATPARKAAPAKKAAPTRAAARKAAPADDDEFMF